ncbi:MAG TPA: nuclear transport factor 2 family protein [Terriglobales bacterium]|nr:nuclear transport factor 2 family protein [Terriglobales bacterium]
MRNCGMVIVCICAAVLLGIPAQAAVRDGVEQPSPTSSIQQELIDLQKAFVAAQERGDADYVQSALAENFTQIEMNGDTSGKKEFVKDIHPEERPGPSPILYDFNVIELDEGGAVVTYQAVIAGSQLERYQHVSDTWVKQHGKWKLKFQQSTLNLWSAHDLD